MLPVLPLSNSNNNATDPSHIITIYRFTELTTAAFIETAPQKLTCLFVLLMSVKTPRTGSRRPQLDITITLLKAVPPLVARDGVRGVTSKSVHVLDDAEADGDEAGEEKHTWQRVERGAHHLTLRNRERNHIISEISPRQSPDKIKTHVNHVSNSHLSTCNTKQAKELRINIYIDTSLYHK